MLHIYFRQTMDHFGIKGSELAEAMGCSRNNISEIRQGKTKPHIDRFWEIIETMDSLSPGAKSYFSNLIAADQKNSGENVYQALDLEKLIAVMNDEQLSRLMLAVAARLGSQKNKSVRLP